MKTIFRFSLFILMVMLFTGCTAPTPAAWPSSTITAAPTPEPTEALAIGQTAAISEALSVQHPAADVYVATHRYPWPANVLIVEVGQRERVMVGTPYTPEATKELLAWLEVHLGSRQVTAINTGYHVDNLGGNAALLEAGIPVYGSDRTAEMLSTRGEAARSMMLDLLKKYQQDERWLQAHREIPYLPPDHLFPIADGKTLTVGGQQISIFYPGPSHAPDNVAVYFPTQRVLYGGCMLVERHATPNIEDADLDAWPAAVEKLKAYQADFVIPAHFQNYDPSVIEGTLEALSKYQ